MGHPTSFILETKQPEAMLLLILQVAVFTLCPTAESGDESIECYCTYNCRSNGTAMCTSTSRVKIPKCYVGYHENGDLQQNCLEFMFLCRIGTGFCCEEDLCNTEAKLPGTGTGEGNGPSEPATKESNQASGGTNRVFLMAVIFPVCLVCVLILIMVHAVVKIREHRIAQLLQVNQVN